MASHFKPRIPFLLTSYNFSKSIYCCPRNIDKSQMASKVIRNSFIIIAFLGIYTIYMSWHLIITATLIVLGSFTISLTTERAIFVGRYSSMQLWTIIIGCCLLTVSYATPVSFSFWPATTAAVSSTISTILTSTHGSRTARRPYERVKVREVAARICVTSKPSSPSSISKFKSVMSKLRGRRKIKQSNKSHQESLHKQQTTDVEYQTCPSPDVLPQHPLPAEAYLAAHEQPPQYTASLPRYMENRGDIHAMSTRKWFSIPRKAVSSRNSSSVPPYQLQYQDKKIEQSLL